MSTLTQALLGILLILGVPLVLLVLINTLRRRQPDVQARKRFNLIINLIGITLIILMVWNAQRTFNERRLKAIQAGEKP